MSYAERLYGKCPVCEQYKIPAGKIVCCQNTDCSTIVDTSIIIYTKVGAKEGKYKVIGEFKEQIRSRKDEDLRNESR